LGCLTSLSLPVHHNHKHSCKSFIDTNNITVVTMATTSTDTTGWSAKQLYEDSTTQLLGEELVRAAEEYSDEELLAQANRWREKRLGDNSIRKNISNACEQFALARNTEPMSWRVEFDRRRGAKLKERFPEKQMLWIKMINAKLSVRTGTSS